MGQLARTVSKSRCSYEPARRQSKLAIKCHSQRSADTSFRGRFQGAFQ